MKSTVSEGRVPEYPTVSVNVDDLKGAFVSITKNFDTANEAAWYKARHHSPVLAEDFSERIESGYLTISVEAEKDNGAIREHEKRIDYEVTVGDEFYRVAENVENVVENSDFEKGLWKIDGRYEGASGSEVAEKVDGMALTPALEVRNDLGDISLGWFPIALTDGVEFGYRAFPSREFQGDDPRDYESDEEMAVDLLNRIGGQREEERNEHPLSDEEVEVLRGIEEEMREQGLM